jgi:hypothetical protein
MARFGNMKYVCHSLPLLDLFKALNLLTLNQEQHCFHEGLVFAL